MTNSESTGAIEEEEEEEEEEEDDENDDVVVVLKILEVAKTEEFPEIFEEVEESETGGDLEAVVEAAEVEEVDVGGEVREEEEEEEEGEEEEMGTRDCRRIIVERRSPKKNVDVWTEVSYGSPEYDGMRYRKNNKQNITYFSLFFLPVYLLTATGITATATCNLQYAKIICNMQASWAKNSFKRNLINKDLSAGNLWCAKTKQEEAKHQRIEVVSDSTSSISLFTSFTILP